MQRIDCRHVELEQRLAAGADDIRASAGSVLRPVPGHGPGKLARAFELGAARATGADKLRVTEPAHGIRPVLLAARPEVAAGEAQKDRRATRLSTFPLQGVVDLADRVSHGPTSGSSMPASANPRALNLQASQRPQGGRSPL